VSRSIFFILPVEGAPRPIGFLFRQFAASAAVSLEIVR